MLNSAGRLHLQTGCLQWRPSCYSPKEVPLGRCPHLPNLLPCRAKLRSLDPTAISDLQSLSCPRRPLGPHLSCEISFSQDTGVSGEVQKTRQLFPSRAWDGTFLWFYNVLLSQAACRRAKPNSGICTIPKQVHSQITFLLTM